jgi:chaperonin GroEL
VIMQLLARREKSNFKVAAIHPPEYGHWRKAMLEDIAITTGGKVISADLGGRLEKAELHDLGTARQVRISSSKTLITAGKGDPKKVAARREQVMRQYDAAPENIERDKFQERIAKLSGGTAMILAGGATPVEQKRRTQLIEDAINATRAAIEEGVVPGGGLALLKAAPELNGLISTTSPPTPASTATWKWRKSPRARTAMASMSAMARPSIWSRPASSIRSRSPTAPCAMPRPSRASSSRRKH